jgi:imidazoleglycerol-phosphate dehydratase/histidinol-phosphatase
MTLERILFIDRDGTLIEEPHDKQVDSLAKLRLAAGVIAALLELARAGFRFVLVSNQEASAPSFPERTSGPQDS